LKAVFKEGEALLT
jgi:hypothetical protein